MSDLPELDRSVVDAMQTAAKQLAALLEPHIRAIGAEMDKLRPIVDAVLGLDPGASTREAFIAGLSCAESGDIAKYSSWDEAADVFVRRGEQPEPEKPPDVPSSPMTIEELNAATTSSLFVDGLTRAPKLEKLLETAMKDDLKIPPYRSAGPLPERWPVHFVGMPSRPSAAVDADVNRVIDRLGPTLTLDGPGIGRLVTAILEVAWSSFPSRQEMYEALRSRAANP